MADSNQCVGVNSFGLDGETQGPTITMAKTHFHVDLGFDSKLWLTNPIKIISSRADTAGEENRLYIHDRLDECLDKFIKGEDYV